MIGLLRRVRWQRLKPDFGAPDRLQIEARTLYALAVLLLLVQLPHVFHLPIWVTGLGGLLVLLRLLLLRYPKHRILRPLLSPLSVTAIAAIAAVLLKLDYGYLLGRDPSVAFLYILVGAKFAEVRRASDATLLLCLCAFLLLTQYFYSQTIMSALITLPAVLALGYALAILRDPHSDTGVLRQLKLVCVLTLQGLPLAALLFILFPRLPGPLWSLPEDAMAATGLSDSMAPGSIGQLTQSDAVAFRVEFDNEPPARHERYWRGPVLSEFDGRRWSTTTNLPNAVPRYSGPDSDLSTYTVMLQPHRQRWLFALETAVALPVKDLASGDTVAPPAVAVMKTNGQLLSASPVNQVLRYRQQSLISNSLPVSHQPGISTLSLPGRNNRSIEYAKAWRNRLSGDRAFVREVMQWFNEESFFYTLQPQLLGDAPVDEFLFDTRRGFCEHYAAAFVVLMRAAGIPARVVTGYLGGEMNGDYMIVRQSDAHAWAEVWLDGRWHRFDPTSAVAPSRVEQNLAAALPDELNVPGLARTENSWLRRTQLRWDALNHHWQRLVVDFDRNTQKKLWQKLGLPDLSLFEVTVVILLFAGVWTAFVVGLPLWQRNHLAKEERLWQGLSMVLHRAGHRRLPSETHSEYLYRAGERWPSLAECFDRVSDGMTELRFKPGVTGPDRQIYSDVSRDVRAISMRLRLRAPGRRQSS